MKMGSLGDEGDGKYICLESDTTEDLYDEADTQIFDSQFSPSSFHGGEFNGEGADGIHFLLSTQRFDDNVGPEDGFETQVMNLGGETQVLNLSGETQVMMNLGGETQVTNLGDETQLVNLGDGSQDYYALDSFENIATQLFIDDDAEVAVKMDTGKSDRNEISVDNEALPDDDTGKPVHDSMQGTDTNRCITLDVNDCGQHKAESDASSNEHRHSGSMHRCFTSIRTASIRAFGLAARKSAPKDGNSQSRSSLSGSPCMKKHDTEHNKIPFKYVEEIDQDCSPEEYAEQMQGPRKENNGRVGRPTARKLFSDDAVAENKEFNDLPPLSHFDNELAGLSYVESQEPGELSQANALNFVDKFLKVSVINFDQENDNRKSSRWKSDPLSCAKGTQRLAKSANLMNTVLERGIFDWDDNREDEGGGEFYKKKKEVLYNAASQKQKSLPQSVKTRRAYSKSELVVDASEGKENHLGIHDRLIRLVSSGSKTDLDTNNASRYSNDMPKSFKGQKKPNAEISHSKKISQPKRLAKLSNDPSVLSPRRSLRIRKLCDQDPVDKSKSDKDASMGFREEMNNHTILYPKRRRSSQRLSSLDLEINVPSVARSTRSKTALLGNSLDLSVKRKLQSADPVIDSLGRQSGDKMLQPDTHMVHSKGISHYPLLQGKRVLITPNTKPGKEILSSLVKAAHGLAVQRIGRTTLKDNKLTDYLLVLSCEEDYADCVPFLERGVAVYSSELLLNGIVTQRLEYDRYRLFTDRFKKTRSTIWLRKDTNQYHPVTKCK